VTESEIKTLDEQARDQFAALGLFIESFENVVSILRQECSRILRGAQLGLPSVAGKIIVFHWNICTLPFHHEAMTAKPIVDIWQALTYEQTRSLEALSALSPNGNKIVTAIVSDVANDFRDMIPTRNHLVHGTWNIGRPWPENFPKELAGGALSHHQIVEKYKVTKAGLEKRDDLPNSFDEIIDLAKRNQQILGMLGRFLQLFIYSPAEIENAFAKRDGTWVITLGTRTERWTPSPSR
jgi:hypothetical protein